MKPLTRRLKAIMDAHLIGVNPRAQTLKPIPVKRRSEAKSTKNSLFKEKFVPPIFPQG